MDLNLRGKTAVVTGSSKGIGFACAMLLAEEGCNLHLTSRTGADLEAAREAIMAKHQVGVTIHPMDLSARGNAKVLSAACSEADILINNAGAIPGGDLWVVDEDTWREAWDLKVFGYINMCREMYAHMKARGGGTIVNIIGTGGERQDFGYIAGAAGNASLMSFTRALGCESAKDNIRVCAVNPGMIATERLETLLRRKMVEDGKNGDDWLQLTSKLPFGRPGSPEEVANLAIFLASDRGSYISGTVMTVDAGQAARPAVAMG